MAEGSTADRLGDSRTTRGRLSAGSRGDSSSGTRSSRGRVMTPTKQVSLQMARKKDDNEDAGFGELNWAEYTAQEDARLNAVKNKVQEIVLNSETTPVVQSVVKNNDSDEADDESTDTDESEEERKAPNQLLMEFVECLMKGEFETAEKLRQMILIYEPTNSEALEYGPLIEERLKIDAESDEGSSTEDSSDEDGSGDDDSDDSSSSDDDSSSEDAETSTASNKPDSGVASATDQEDIPGQK